MISKWGQSKNTVSTCIFTLTPLLAPLLLASALAGPVFSPASSAAENHHLFFSEAFDLQAHRGGTGLVTENTLESFANAIDLGVNTLEMDIQITEDKMAIVTHDRQVQAHKCRDTLPAFNGDTEFPYVGKYVKDLSLQQLRTLDCGSIALPAHPWQRMVPGARIPLLSEVFELVKAARADTIMLNIEPKVEAGAPHETAPREEFTDIVLKEIRSANMEAQVTIQSFDWGTLMQIRELAPELPIIALSNAQSFLRCGEEGASPWTGGIDMDDFDCNLPAAAASFGANAISPVHGLPQDGRFGQGDYEAFVTPAMVEQTHALGMKIIPWTVNDRSTAEYLIGIGVDGIITDYPDKLLEILGSE